MPAQLTNLKVRDVAIKLHRAGRGPTVLFLHGAGGVPQWLPFFEALAESYELLVPEHLGFGGSDDPPWIHSMPDLAMFYLDLLEETGLDRIDLIGNSLGGWLAAEILIRDRSRFRSSSSSRRRASASRECRAATTMLRYRDLLRVEQLLRQAKAVLATRPIYHSSDIAIRGHVFCSFLALLLAKELEDRLHRHAVAAEWGDILRDLDRLQEIDLEQDGKRFLLRTPTTGVAGRLFQAVGVALPPNVQELPQPAPQSPT